MTVLHRNLRPATDDRTRFDPSMTPYVIIAEKANSSRAVVYNAAMEPIATIEANSPRQLSEIGRTIEHVFQERDSLLDSARERDRAEHRNQGRIIR